MDNIYALKKGLLRGLILLWPAIWIKKCRTLFDHRHSGIKVCVKLSLGERTYAPDKDFSCNSAMTFNNFKPRNMFQNHWRFLPKANLWVKYYPDWVKGRKICLLWTKDDGRTEHYRAPAERNPNTMYVYNLH